MKGALIGSTYSGKTTGLAYLTYNLGYLRTKIGIGNEVAIDCPYPLGENGEFSTQWWIVTHQIEREQRPRAFQLKIDSAFKLMFAFPDINKIPIYTIIEQDKEKRNKEIYNIVKEV